MAGDTDQAGRYDAVVDAIRDGQILMIPGVPQTEAPKPLTFDEIEILLAAYQPPPPPAQLRCHPSVLRGLIGLIGEPSGWPSHERPDLVRIEIYTDPDLADGAWELHRGDEVVDQGVIAPEATA